MGKFPLPGFSELVMKTELVRKILIIRLACAALLAFSLSACTSSDNLPDPIDNGVTVTECDTSSVDCVSGQFIANDVIEGLDYECGNVRSVTGRDGNFTCPINSKATFFIGFPESKTRIILGVATIKQSNLPTGTSATGLQRRPIRLSPLDLVGVADAGATLANPRVINILRFLKALDSDDLDGNGRGWDEASGGTYKVFHARNHILISSMTRQLVSDPLVVAKTIEATAFLNCEASDPDCEPCENGEVPGCSLNPALKDFVRHAIDANWDSKVPSGSTKPLDLLTIVPPAAVAKSQMEASLQAATAAVYATQSPISCTIPYSSNTKAAYENAMCAGHAPDGRAGHMYLYVDRVGYAFGMGMAFNVSQDFNSNLNLRDVFTQPRRIVLEADNAAAGAGHPIDYKTSLFQLKGTEVAQNNPVEYGWKGKMQLGLIASTADNYKILYGDTAGSGDSSQFGKWTISAPTAREGQFMLVTYKPVNAWLDSSVFTEAAFPMNIKVQFRYHKSDTACPVPSGTTPTTDAEKLAYLKSVYCKALKVDGVDDSDGQANKLYLTILPSGNIVTNTAAVKSDCVVDDVSGVVPMRGGHAETRVGFVSSVVGTKLSLTMLFGNDLPYEEWRSILAGEDGSLLLDTSTSATSLLLDEIKWTSFWRSYEPIASGVTDPLEKGLVEIEKVDAADACAP